MKQEFHEYRTSNECTVFLTPCAFNKKTYMVEASMPD